MVRGAWLRTALTTSETTPAALSRVAHVLRRSCGVGASARHVSTPGWPSGRFRTILDMATEIACAVAWPVTPLPPLYRPANTNGELPDSFIASVIRSRARGDSGTRCGLPFFDRSAGISHAVGTPSRPISSEARAIAATSPGRAPVARMVRSAGPITGETGGNAELSH